ncbi:xylulokinase [Cryptosporangium sp. NPDC051539]|uniref:xylulokinase n=1 Tax=Cryptosporangium sp. NPDC051539 TaxID=3363962 RepID=UPI0037984944
MALVAGVDCSTQSTKVLICDSETGAVVRQGRAPHPDATEVDPAIWWSALREASDGLLDGVEAIAVGGQQHGMVTLDSDGQVVRPALLWNDTRSADAATDLLGELGGAQAWVDAVGLVPVASFTITKLRWLAENEPDEAKRVERVLLPHDWLTWKLSGGSIDPTTDRGDASGTGYWSAATGEYRPDLLRRAFGRDLAVPAVAGPKAVVGHTPEGIALAAGTGDNMAAALGLGAGPGDVVVSLGTSGTVFAVAEGPTADPSGYVAGFADATGRFLPLVCTLNAARVLTAAADLLGADLDRLSDLALASTPGAAGLTLLPYLDGERTPDLPDETGRLNGLTRANARPENLARAAVEGMLLGLADGLDAVRQHGVAVRRALLIGGAAMSPAVRAVASGILGVPVEVPAPGEYVALGAARQAAWALSGAAEPPQWSVDADKAPDAVDDYAPVRARYAQFRTEVQELSTRPSKS